MTIDQRKVMMNETKSTGSIDKAVRRALKERAKKNVRLNYIACIAVCFIMVFIASEYHATVQNISAYDRVNVADMKYDAEDKLEIIDDMLEKKLTYEEASDKWHVGDPAAVKRWHELYKANRLDALTAKEITFFASAGDTSNIDILLNALNLDSTARQKAKFYLNERGLGFVSLSSAYFDIVTKNHSYKFSLINTFVGLARGRTPFSIMTSLIYTVFLFVFTMFVVNILIVSERRFFLENHSYHGTRSGRLGFLLRERTFKPALTMLLKDVYFTLWSCTVVMIPVKIYDYMFVPYILAENPNIGAKKAIKLSRDMIKGHRMEIFKLDMTMLGWYFLTSISFGFVGIFYVNPYVTALNCECYLYLRRQAIENGMEGSEEFNDCLLDLDLYEEQLLSRSDAEGRKPDMQLLAPVHTITDDYGENKDVTLGELRTSKQYPGLRPDAPSHFSRFANKVIVHRDYHRKYDIWAYIGMFFAFSFGGFVWEVAIHFIEDGIIVNRGTLSGPWLPIYGVGGVLAVLLLKKFIDSPVLTFVIVFFGCSVLEFGTAMYLDKVKHIKYWNYTGYFGNIDGKVCIEGAMVFGFAACATIYILGPLVDDMLKKLKPAVKIALCTSLVVVFIADNVYTKFHPHEGEGITDYAASVSVSEVLTSEDSSDIIII